MRILHGHIFKNGGTTFEGILTNTFGNKHIMVEDEIRMHREKGGYLNQLLGGNKYNALSSHFLPVRDALKDRENFVVVFLRDPILRALSVYEFEKKQKHDTLGAINAKRMSAKEYFEWRLSEDAPPTIRDFQTRFVYQTANIDRVKLDQLQRFISQTSCLFLGVVERFDDSLALLQKALDPYGIDLDRSYERKNENKKTNNWSDEEKTTYLKELIGENLFEKLRKQNEKDILLYQNWKKYLF